MDPVKGKVLVTGSIQVYYNGKCVTKDSSIIFNKDSLENLPYKLEPDGRFTCQLPVGTNYISKVYYQNNTLKLPTWMAKFDLTEDKKINYLGDLSVDWQHSNFQGAMITAATFLTGIVGGLIVWGLTDALSEERQHQLLYAENNIAEARIYLSLRYNNQLELTDMTFDFPEPGKYFEPKQPVDHSLNPDFLTFKTHNNNVCYGNLRFLKKKKIYIQCENTIYVIPRKNLKIITNHTGETISLKSISNQRFKPLNFDSYKIITL